MIPPRLPLSHWAVTGTAPSLRPGGPRATQTRRVPGGQADRASQAGTHPHASLHHWWLQAILAGVLCMATPALPAAMIAPTQTAATATTAVTITETPAAATPQHTGPASANDASDLETRVRDISHQLRCLVCQNQSIAESSAPLALDLRNQVRDMLRQGKDASAITRYMTDRYGDFVLYQPPLRGTTLLLWLGPFALLLAGMVALVQRLRRHARHRDPPLTPAQQAAAQALLSPETGPGASPPRTNAFPASNTPTGGRP